MLIFNINYHYTVEIHNAMKYETTKRVQCTAKRDKDNHDENFQLDFRETDVRWMNIIRVDSSAKIAKIVSDQITSNEVHSEEYIPSTIYSRLC